MGAIPIHRAIGEDALRGLMVEIKRLWRFAKLIFCVFYRTMCLCFCETQGTTKKNRRQDEESCCHHLQAPAVHWAFELKWPLFPQREFIRINQ